MTRYEMKNHKFGKWFHPHAYHQLFAAHGFADALSSWLHCWDLFIFDILRTTVHWFIIRCTALLPKIDKHSDFFQKLHATHCLRLEDSFVSQRKRTSTKLTVKGGELKDSTFSFPSLSRLQIVHWRGKKLVLRPTSSLILESTCNSPKCHFKDRNLRYHSSNIQLYCHYET